MATSSTTTSFKSIQLFKEEILGIGAYGKVCRAKCDSLPCAAKIIHETLFDPTAEQQMPRGHEHRLPIRRFEQECQLLNTIRHPNVIQYLGMYTDPDTGLPVLLMELMDDSLTHFLEAATKQIPYHIQVNICHDIAMALTFLHANGIVHRDLSSNNVLLISNIRAKVTDFGMAKLGDINPRASRLTFTMCPGTDAYMPPEAIQDQPVYSEKIDCFSFGVIVIQMLTRQFPKPGDRMQKVEINHQGLPRGTLMVCIPEVDRRQNHISLVDPNHTLLPISLDCLKDRDAERPSAQQLCERVAALKEQSMYTESARQSETDIHCAHPSEIRLRWRRGKTAPEAMFRWSNAAASEDEVYFNAISRNRVYSYNLNSELWSRLPDCPNEHCSFAVIDNKLTAIGGAKDASGSAVRGVIRAFSNILIGGQYCNKLYSLKQRAQRSQWVEDFPPMPTKRCSTASICTKTSLIVAGGHSRWSSLTCVEVMNRETRQWSVAADMPGGMYRSSGVICGDRLYVGGDGSKSVYSCSLSDLLQSCQSVSPTEQESSSNTSAVWNKLTDLPEDVARGSTLVSLCGQLLAIGGKTGMFSVEIISKAVYIYKTTTNSWEVISQMLVPRCGCFAVTLPTSKVMVVGGCSEMDNDWSDTVEFAELI